jgi:CDI immunity proteins
VAQTIEQLENDFWREPEFLSHVVVTSHALRKKPIDQFEVEDLRFMIGQNIGTQYLMPKALGLLEQTPLLWDYHFPGEVLHSILKLPDVYWSLHSEQLKRMCGIIGSALKQTDESLIQETKGLAAAFLTRCQRK